MANYLGQGWVALMGFIFIPIYVRLLGIEAYGLIGFFGVLQASLTMLDLGMTPTLTREMARFKSGHLSPKSIKTLLRSVEIIFLCLGVCVAMAVWVLSHWIATYWVNTQEVETITAASAIGLMGLVIALRFFESIYRGAIVGLNQQIFYNVLAAGMATVRSVGSVAVLVWVSPTIQAFFLWQVFVSFLASGALFFATYFYLGSSEAVRPSFRSIASVYKFAGGMTGVMVLGVAITQIDKFMVSSILPLSGFGAYMLAATAAGLIYFFVTPITQVFFPLFCGYFSGGYNVEFRGSYHTSTQLVSVIVGSISAVLIIMSERVVLLWTGDLDLTTQVSPVLSIMAAGNLLNAICHIPYYSELARGKFGLVLAIYFVGLILIVIGLLLAVPLFGAIGAASIWAIVNAIYFFVGVSLINRRLQIEGLWGWYVVDVALPVSVAFSVVGSLNFFVAMGASSAQHMVLLFVSLVLSVAAAALCASRLRFFVFNHFISGFGNRNS